MANPAANTALAANNTQYAVLHKTVTTPAFIESLKKSIPRHIDADVMVRTCLSQLRDNSRLLQVASNNPQSFLLAIMQAGHLGLVPDGFLGKAYLIPYGNEVSFQLGYHGLLELAYRSGMVDDADMDVVMEGDEFEYEYGTNKHLTHKPCRERGRPTHYYALIYVKGSARPHFKVMTIEDVEAHRDRYSKAKDRADSAWVTAFDAMAMKTVLIQALKLIPKSTELQRAIQYEERSGVGASVAGMIDAPLPALPVMPTGEDLPDIRPEPQNKTDTLAGKLASKAKGTRSAPKTEKPVEPDPEPSLEESIETPQPAPVSQEPQQEPVQDLGNRALTQEERELIDAKEWLVEIYMRDNEVAKFMKGINSQTNPKTIRGIKSLTFANDMIAKVQAFQDEQGK